MLIHRRVILELYLPFIKINHNDFAKFTTEILKTIIKNDTDFARVDFIINDDLYSHLQSIKELKHLKWHKTTNTLPEYVIPISEKTSEANRKRQETEQKNFKKGLDSLGNKYIGSWIIHKPSIISTLKFMFFTRFERFYSSQ